MSDRNDTPSEQPRESAASAVRGLSDLRLAISFLTRLPLPAGNLLPGSSLAASSWAFPAIGILIGGIGGGVFFCASQLGLGIASASLLALLSQIAVTGALHEDGLADTADGFGGGHDRSRKLEIMRDSRIGSYGVIALLLALGLRFAAVSELAGSLISVSDEYEQVASHTGAVFIVLITAGALSRGGMVCLWYLLPPARADGLSAGAGVIPIACLLIAGGSSVLVAFILLAGPAFIAATVTAVAATLCMVLLAKRQIGGQTGDVLGATQQVVEITVLLAISAVTIAV